MQGIEKILSPELWLYLLQFVEDVDLIQVSKTSVFFNQLALDKILWRKIMFEKNRARVQHKLHMIPQRPNREQLVHHGILRGVTFRMLQEGEYINGGGLTSILERSKQLNWIMIHNLLSSKLTLHAEMYVNSHRSVLSKGYSAHHWTSIPQTKKGFMPNESIHIPNPLYSLNNVDASLLHRTTRPLLPIMISLRNRRLLNDLDDQLRRRISYEKLKTISKAHEITAPSDAPYKGSLLPRQLQLHRLIRARTLKQQLMKRPSVENLESCKVLHTGPITAQWLCPSIQPKVRFYNRLVAI